MRRLTLALTMILLPAMGLSQGAPVQQGPPNVPEFSPAFPNQTRAPATTTGTRFTTQVVASGLQNPWGIAVLPGGLFLVTERAGRLRLMDSQGNMSGRIAGLPTIRAADQGGLLDVAVSPNFASDRTVFFTYSKPRGGSQTATAVGRGVLNAEGTRLTDVRDIFIQSPNSRSTQHYGSRIVFDRNGNLYVTLGERAQGAARAQDNTTTFGKVIRITPEGAPVPGNPFIGREGEDTIWSYGHRNPQGAALHPSTGEIWTVEHGPRGGDELNQPEPGRNYGWPLVSYGEGYLGNPIGTGQPRAEGLEEPVYYWDPVIAPSGMTFYTGNVFPAWRGDLFIASLRPGGVVRLELSGERVTGEERLLGELGRVRDVEVAPDGTILVLTDSGNGRIVRLVPAS